MAVKTTIQITHDLDASTEINSAQVGVGLIMPTHSPRKEAEAIRHHLEGMIMGSRMGQFDVQVNNGDAAGATVAVTLTSVKAGDILIINGVAFTAVASGATGNQWVLNASNTTSATNLKAAINAATDVPISGLLSATSALGVVTITGTINRGLGLFTNGFYVEGQGSGAIAVAGSGVQASGTFTFSSIANTDTLVINGVTFTCVTSGATGDQFNVGASDTAAATNAAAAINASVTTLISDYVYASSAAGVVTIKSRRAGKMGNLVTLTGGTHVSASGARATSGTDSPAVLLTAGTDATANAYKFGV